MMDVYRKFYTAWMDLTERGFIEDTEDGDDHGQRDGWFVSPDARIILEKVLEEIHQ